MSEQQLDAQGEAHDALNSAVASFGPRILSDPRILGNVVTDLLPDLPREQSLLVTAAEADVAGELTQHVEEQHLNPDTAVQLVAHALAERRSIDPAASMWVATEYAQALGYPVRSYAPSAGAAPPVVTPEPPPTITTPAAQGPPPPAQGWDGGPAGGHSPYSVPPPPTGGQPQGPGWPTQPGPGPGFPPPTPKRRNRGPIIAAIAVAAVVVLYFVVAAVAGITPFAKSKSHPVASPTPTHPTVPPSHHTTPATSGPSLAANVAPLVQLLPSDVNPANCKAKPKTGWATPGLVKSLACTDSGVGTGDSIYAYQMNSLADYQASWANFNTWWGFSAPSGTSCPPSGSSTQGNTTWDDSGSKAYFPTAAGQVLECGVLQSNNNQPEPTYAWAFPSEDAYIIAIGDPNSTFSHLDKWWTDNSEPNASPSPATP